MLLPKKVKEELEKENRIKKYYTEHRTTIDENDFSGNGGFVTYKVLPELTGCKVDMFAISLVRALGATEVRISYGTITCDTNTGRATIIVDENDIIKTIDIGLSVWTPVGYNAMCGYDFDKHIKENKSKTLKERDKNEKT